jgi:toxin ParE1/3/4
MTRIELAPEVLEDFDRRIDHLTQHEVPDAALRITEVPVAI